MFLSNERIPNLRKGARSQAEGTTIRLVVSEDGAARFDSEVLPDGRDETVVIAQLRGESPLETVHRGVARVASLERSRRRVESALILVSPRCDAEFRASRMLLALALMSHMAAAQDGELVLCADEPDDELYDQLATLVDRLRTEFAYSGVDVRLRVRGARSSPMAIGSIDALSDGAAA